MSEQKKIDIPVKIMDFPERRRKLQPGYVKISELFGKPIFISGYTLASMFGKEGVIIYFKENVKSEDRWTFTSSKVIQRQLSTLDKYIQEGYLIRAKINKGERALFLSRV